MERSWIRPAGSKLGFAETLGKEAGDVDSSPNPSVFIDRIHDRQEIVSENDD